MPDQIIQPDVPFTYDPGLTYRVAPDEDVTTLAHDEAAAMVEVPSIDLKDYQSRNTWTLAGQGMVDGLLKMTTENAATQMIVAGRLEESRDPRGGKSLQLRFGEKLRNFNIALRNKIGMEEQAIKPSGFGETVTMGVGAGVTNLMGMIGARAAGAAAGFAAAGPAGAAVTGIAVPFAFSYSQERANMAQNLMDAGFSPQFVDTVSDIYAFPAAALDYASFGYLSKLARPLAASTIKTVFGRGLVSAAANKAGQIAVAGVKGILSEGTTEALQQRYQTEIEIGVDARKRDFLNDLTDDVVAFVIGGGIGGTVGASGQFRIRNQAIEKVVKEFDISRSDAAKLYDESVLRANHLVLDELTAQMDLTNDVAWVDKAFSKTESQTDLTVPEMVEPGQTAEEYAASRDLLDAESILVDAKTAEIQRQVRGIQKEQTGIRQQIADLVRERRLVKIDAKQAFMKEMGREPAEGELGPWATNRSIQLESQINPLTEKVAQAEVALRQAQADFGTKIQGLPQQKDIAALEATLDKAYTRQSELMEELANTPADKAKGLVSEKDALDQRIAAIELRLENMASRPEAVKAAEKKVDAAATKMAGAFVKLEETEKALRAIRENAATAFVTEKGRSAKDATELKDWVTKKQESLDAEMQKLQTDIDKLTQEIVKAEALAEDFRQNLARVEGRVEMRASQVRTMAKQDLRNVLQAFKAGRKVSEKEFKAVQKAFVTLFKGTKLPRSAVTLALRKVLTVRTADQFNTKAGAIVDAINTVLRSEKVRQHQKLGKQILAEMLPQTTGGKVSPETQVFAEHLMRVFREQVPLQHDRTSEDPKEIARAVAEQAVYDLVNAADDTGAASRAVLTLRNFFVDNLQAFKDYKARQDQTYERLSKLVQDTVSGGQKINIGEEALDASRQQVKRSGVMATLAPTPYTMSFMSILDAMDKASGYESMQGPLVKAFSSEGAFKAWIVHTNWAKENIDGKMGQIYGKKALEIWKDHIGADFLEVPYSENGEAKKQMISRSAAMSMMLMLKMPSIRADFLKMGIDEAWLDAFESGEVANFTKQDYEWMQNVRDVLDQYADKIAPVYERLTGKPFRRIDNYFMVMRYLNQSVNDGGTAETSSIVSNMLQGKFDSLDPTNEDRLKERTKNQHALQLPDIYQAMSQYALDMNHFLGYAEYAVTLQQAFQNTATRRVMEKHLPPAYPAVIDEFIRTITEGSISRSSDRKAMKGFFMVLSTYARNQIAPLKNIPRQFSGLAAFTELPGIGAIELADAVRTLPEAIKSGELRALLDTSYMRERYAGMYDFAARYAQEMARAEWFSSIRGKGPLSALRRGMASQTLHNFVTFSSRYGDRAASVVGGWAVYSKVMKETGNQMAAIDAAVKAIDDTQQSMDIGKVPVAFNRSDLPARLLTLFRRTPAIYLDRYMRAWKAKKEGRLSNDQFLRTMLTYHLWVPLFEVLVTAGKWEPWETATAMAAGPLSFHLIFGQMIASLAAGVIEGASGGEAELPGYLKNVAESTLVGSFAKDVTKLVKKVGTMIAEGPDLENMWATTKAVGQVGDISPVPMGWIVQTPEGIYDLLSMEWEQMWNGILKIGGYGEGRTTPKN